jgi:DNA-3-methyladenine glycosylase
LLADRLPRSFYARPTLEVARDLLGKRLVRILNSRAAPQSKSPENVNAADATSPNLHRLSGYIVEVEAYAGLDDLASHARSGRTERNAPMFGRPGHAYVYFVYGMHWMFNVVARKDVPGAVLIRALSPVEGMSVMRDLRGGQPDRLLTSGPARLAQAFAIDGALSGIDLCTDSRISVEEGKPISDNLVVCGPRVGVSGDELARTRPWRFRVKSAV